MKSEKNQYYGCCKNIDSKLLQSGEKWKYPKWYINYIKGEGKKQIPNRALNLLSTISDDEWQKGFDASAGIGNYEACVELKLIKEKLVECEEDTYTTYSKISPRGKEVLKNKYLP